MHPSQVPGYLLDECRKENLGAGGNLRQLLSDWIDNDGYCGEHSIPAFLYMNLCVGHMAAWCIAYDHTHTHVTVSIWSVPGFRRLGYATEIVRKVERHNHDRRINNFKATLTARGFWNSAGW